VVCGYVGCIVEVDGALFIQHWALDFLSKNCLETCYKVFHIVDLFNVNEAKGIGVSLNHPTHLSYLGFSFSYVLFFSVSLMPIGLLPLL